MLGLLVLLVLVGTVTDALSSLLQERMPPTSTIAEFSAIRTLRFIFTMKKKANDDSFLFINGIRVLSLFWVIFGHSFLFEIYYTMNNVDVLAWSHNLAFQLILRGLLSVDTFFVLSGFLTAVLFLRQVTKEGLSSRFMFMYYVHRYIRLTPTFILVMFTSMYLTPYMGRGPMYPSEQGFESEACHQHHYWWTSFFYIGNLIKPDNTCLSVSWYLFNDMQFHWIAPLALIPFAMGRKRIGFGIATCFVLASIASIAGLLLHYPHIYPNTIGNALQQPASAVSIFVLLWKTKVERMFSPL